MPPLPKPVLPSLSNVNTGVKVLIPFLIESSSKTLPVEPAVPGPAYVVVSKFAASAASLNEAKLCVYAKAFVSIPSPGSGASSGARWQDVLILIPAALFHSLLGCRLTYVALL